MSSHRSNAPCTTDLKDMFLSCADRPEDHSGHYTGQGILRPLHWPEDTLIITWVGTCPGHYGLLYYLTLLWSVEIMGERERVDREREIEREGERERERDRER